MKISFRMDRGEGIRVSDAAQRIMATGLTNAMKEIGKQAAAAANTNIRSAGFSSRKWEIRAKNYPSSGISLLPEIWLHSRSNFEDVFEEGKTIQKEWLWLPLPSVPLWPGDPTRQMSPKKYIQSVGPLMSFLHRTGKAPILAAPVSGALKPQPFGRFVTKGRLRKGKTGKGAVTFIPLFVGVRSVTIAKRFRIQEAVDSVVGQFPHLYAINESKEPI